MKAFPIECCYDCPACETEQRFDEVGTPAGSVVLCLHMWYEDLGDKKEIPDPSDIPDWCPLKDYIEEVDGNE